MARRAGQSRPAYVLYERMVDMGELISVLSGVLVPILVLAGVVIRAVNAVQKAAPPAQKPPSASQPVQPVFHTRPAPARTSTVPTLSGSAEPPPTAPAAPKAQQRTVSGNIPGEGSPLQRNSLEGAETRWGSLGGIPAGTGVEHGLTQRIKMRMKADPIAEAPRARRTSARPVFAPSRSTLVQGILYAEILGRPGGRRARR
jgi:hypothetical protein